MSPTQGTKGGMDILSVSPQTGASTRLVLDDPSGFVSTTVDVSAHLSPFHKGGNEVQRGH